MMKRSPEVLRQMAEQLHKELAHFAIQSEVVENQGQTGGGALPETTIPGYAVEIRGSFRSARERADFSEQLYRKMLIQPTPVLGILRKGRFLMDVLTLQPEEIPLVAKILGSAYQSPNA
jgi:seryl-tRNA(Sec) selenium transferase